jgi:hypothetical protein
VLFAVGLLMDVSVLFMAVRWVVSGTFGWKARWLLLYALFGLNIDFAMAMVKLDRILNWGGLCHRITLPPAVNFIFDLSSRLSLLIAVWLLIFQLLGIRYDGAR